MGKTNSIGLRACAALAAIAMMTTGAIGQAVPDEGAPGEAQLNLPDNPTIYGPSTIAMRKATAIINGEIITETDVAQRLALVITANGGRVPAEERERLRLQVLRNLIDETLQIQEAKANEITVSDEEVQQSYVRVARNFGRAPDDFAKYLRENGSSEASIKRQIRGELAWSRLLRRRVEAGVSDAEVQAVIDRLNAAKGQTEYHLGEIYLSATAETAGEVFQNGRRIIEQIRAGGSFAAYARQFSEASTKSVGGDTGWIRAGQLPDALDTAMREMKIGQIAGPIEIPGGFSILYMVDQRQVLTADPRDALLSLRQISLPFAPGTTQAQASEKAAAFAAATAKIQGCGGATEIAKSVGAEVVDNSQIPVKNLPPQLQDMMLNLQIGQATPPFGSQEDGVRVLVLCGRDDPQVAEGPSFEQIKTDMEDQKVNRRAQIYLRDLRRDAVVDYR